MIVMKKRVMVLRISTIIVAITKLDGTSTILKEYCVMYIQRYLLIKIYYASLNLLENPDMIVSYLASSADAWILYDGAPSMNSQPIVRDDE